MRSVVTLIIALLFAVAADARPAWETKLDSKILFYQTTDFGIVIAATERYLYAVDGQTGERLWRRSTGRINETAVTPVPGTDLILFSRDLGKRSQLQAVDIISGRSIWESDKLRGDVLQLSADPERNLIAVVAVRNTRGTYGREMKREPVIHMLRMSDGEELWKQTLKSDVSMMPSRFGEGLGDIEFTLDNYRAPLLIDNKLYVFYEGATSFDALTGVEFEREKFNVNEGGLALTEADPLIDEKNIYATGRGRVRAVERTTGKVIWRSDDLGNASELALIGMTLFVRTGGRFTRLRDGEIVSRGPYGVSAIDTTTGKTLWRYKGADKGLTNFTFRDTATILIADRDDLIYLNTATGKRIDKFEHKVVDAQFVLVNQNGLAVVGGKDEIAGFAGKNEVWRKQHKAPGRGVLRVVGGIALRAAALYFRYGGIATSAIGLARTGINAASLANSFRWSGLRSRFGSFDLTTLASSAAQSYTGRIYSFGSLASLPDAARRLGGLQILTPGGIRSGIAGGIARRVTPSPTDVREIVLDRLDPARYAERLSDYLLRRKRVAELRGSHMYFYTDLPRPDSQKGLIGVDVSSGNNTRIVLVSDPDSRFTLDESVGLLYSANGNTLQAFDMINR